MEGLHYLCSKKKGADQLSSYCAADLHLCFSMCKKLVFLWRGSCYSYAFIPGAFGGKPSGSGGDSFTARQTRQHADPNKVDFIFYSLSMSHINSAINRLEKMIDSDLLNKVLSDSVIEQLTGDQVILQLCREKISPVFGFPTRSDTNRAIQPQKKARGLKFRI